MGPVGADGQSKTIIPDGGWGEGEKWVRGIEVDMAEGCGQAKMAKLAKLG
jgi:hypothetical protein